VLRAAASVALLAIVARSGGAQDPPQPPAGSQAEVPPVRGAAPAQCAPVAHVLTLVVRRPDGAPVPDATLTVRDAASGAVLARRARGSDEGVYLVLGDDERPPLPAAGVPLRLEIAHGAQVQHVEWVLYPATGPCGGMRVRGPGRVTLADPR